jgi:uncharacterized membrane protein
MRIGTRNELILLNLLVIVLIAVFNLFPSNILRIILGAPFLLFFPGYTLVTALFSKKEGLDGIERVLLSLVMSIVVVLFLGLILNYTPWGIRPEPILYSTALFIFITSVIAWLRRGQLFRLGEAE